MIATAQIILPLPIGNDYFTYTIPNELSGEVAVGKRVIVEFGGRRQMTGVILSVGESENSDRLRPILQVIDETPILNQTNLKLWKQIADYYLVSLSDIMRAALPSALRLESDTIIRRNPEQQIPEKLSKREVEILDILPKTKAINIDQLDKQLGFSSIATIRRLVEQDLVEISEELTPRYKLPTVDLVESLFSLDNQSEIEDIKDTLKRAKKQLAIVERFIELKQKKETITKAELLKESEGTTAQLNDLVKKGIFQINTELAQKQTESELKTIPLSKLSKAQSTTIAEIRSGFQTKRTCLLHGLTSSGKTEIYSHLIQECLERGKNALMLVPEIGLTGQLVERLSKWFGSRVLAYHSGISERKRLEIRNTILENDTEARLIVGTRSAVFLPFQSLGLIVIDEEHDTSFRQIDQSPRYNAKVATAFMAAEFGANILLGSATPSIDSYAMATTGKISMVELFERYGEVSLPEVEVINLKEAYHKKRMRRHFSLELIDRINQTLTRGEQVILFQNRRGYSLSLSCSDCGAVEKCPKCDVPLTYHKAIEAMKCHYCGFIKRFGIGTCNKCGSKEMDFSGFGTEQVEREARELFPDHKVSRLDFDTAKGKETFSRKIEEFEGGKTDILVGTQIIAKGIDFSRVGLVAVLNADNLANSTDYRATENAFQTLTQICGRAGRKQQGRVVIQTYQPQANWLRCVVDNDYKGFFMAEMQERHLFRYPPYYKLITVTLRFAKDDRLKATAGFLAKMFRQNPQLEVLGPDYPAIARLRGMYQQKILIKTLISTPQSSLQNFIYSCIEHLRTYKEFRGIQIAIEVD